MPRAEPQTRRTSTLSREQILAAAVDEPPEAGLVIRFALGEVVTNPEPTDLSGPEIAQLRIYNPMGQTTD